MKRIDDMKRWTEAALDTPFFTHFKPSSTFYPPGICVKSREREADGEGIWPKHFGRVVEFDKDRDYALVRSYGSRTIWEGSISECLKMWEVD